MEPQRSPSQELWSVKLHQWATKPLSTYSPQEPDQKLASINAHLQEIAKTLQKSPETKKNFVIVLSRIVKKDNSLKGRCTNIFLDLAQYASGFDSAMARDFDSALEDTQQKKDRAAALRQLVDSTHGNEALSKTFLNLANALPDFYVLVDEPEVLSILGKLIQDIDNRGLISNPKISSVDKHRIGDFIHALLANKFFVEDQSDTVDRPLNRILFGLLTNGVSNKEMWVRFFDSKHTVDLLKHELNPQSTERLIENISNNLQLIVPMIENSPQVKENLEILLNMAHHDHPTPAYLAYVTSVLTQLIPDLKVTVPHPFSKESIILPSIDINQLRDKIFIETVHLEIARKDNHANLYKKLLPTELPPEIFKTGNTAEFEHYVRRLAFCAQIADISLKEKKSEVRQMISRFIQLVLFHSNLKFSEEKLNASIKQLSFIRSMFAAPIEKTALQPTSINVSDDDDDFIDLGHLSKLSSKESLDLNLSNFLPQMKQLEALQGLSIHELILHNQENVSGLTAHPKSFPKTHYTDSDLAILKRLFPETKIQLRPNELKFGHQLLQQSLSRFYF